LAAASSVYKHISGGSNSDLTYPISPKNTFMNDVNVKYRLIFSSNPLLNLLFWSREVRVKNIEVLSFCSPGV
jgi:hypothetical protein